MSVVPVYMCHDCGMYWLCDTKSNVHTMVTTEVDEQGYLTVLGAYKG